MNTDEICDDRNRSTRCYATDTRDRRDRRDGRSRHKVSPYVLVVTTALVTFLVAILGWLLMEIREIRETRETTAVAVERTKTMMARTRDLENQIKSLLREQNMQNQALQQVNDWQSLRLIK